eukprot:NODE_1352_length_988_cov_462.144835_g942_i0.p3 GENE.NODE_1352_length_988_cov_462.144835_g942_i0~~NODE_1352_length_988_cov_462.144835_g942_i0.p3  ORF type:complete len:250 (+),score=122.98 NODE_1352_length_988_cov_462.144835_g942_i0:24-752(+)
MGLALAAKVKADPQKGCKPSEQWFKDLRARELEREAAIDKEGAIPAMDRMDSGKQLINAVPLFRKLEATMGPSTVMVADGGDFVGVAAYTVKPRKPLSWLDPGVFGTLGVGGGFAIGAATVRPGAEVWIFWGDGSSGYSIAEYDTATRHKLPILSVIGNDACWAQIERDQTTMLKDNVGCMLTHLDYDLVAQGYGGKGVKVAKEADLGAAFEDAQRQARNGTSVAINALIGVSDFRKGSISV